MSQNIYFVNSAKQDEFGTNKTLTPVKNLCPFQKSEDNQRSCNFKYGKIYIQNSTLKCDGAKQDLEELPGVHFSNNNFLWYNLDGEFHPVFQQYQGKTFFLKFQLKNLADLSGNPIDFTGIISLPLAIGKLESPDFDGVVEAEFEDLENLKRFGVFSEARDKAIMRNLRIAELAATLCPGRKLKDLKLIRAITNWYTLLDDYLDDSDSAGKLSCSDLMQFLEVASNILDGFYIENKTLIQFPEELANHLRSLENIYKNIICEWRDYAEPAINSLKSYLNINCLEASYEWKQMLSETTESKLLTETEKNLRWLNYGGVLTFQLSLFDQRIRVSKNVSNCQFFQVFLVLLGKQAALINDLFSCRKDFKNGETCSEIYILCARDGLSLSDALEKVLDKANELTQKIVVAGNILLKLHNGDEDVAKIVHAALALVNGQYQWLTITPRYEPDLVFDCIVEC